ncbi:MAG: ABC transporter permease [Chloroflexota bacterium]
MKAFNGLFIASFKQFFRDRTALFFTFAFPLLFMVIFGLVFGGNGHMSYDIGLANEADSPVATAISEALKKVSIFKVNEGELDQGLEKLRNGDIRAVVSIPEDIQSRIASGEAASISVYYDPSQTTSTQVILSVLRQLVNEVNQQLTQQPALISLAEKSVQSHDLRDIDYLVPGIVAMSVLFLGLFGALPMVDWREKQVLKRLRATPLSRTVVVSSQVAYRLVLALLQTLLILVVAYFAFDVQVVGSWLVLLGLVLLGTLAFVALGYLAVSRARTTESAMPIIQLIQFPMLFLSGIFFPVDFMPDFMRPIVAAMPLTYLGDAFRQTMVNATPLHPLTVDVAVLTAWLVVSMLLAVRLFRWD